jgi:hypothetical protein
MIITLINREGTGINRQWEIDLPVLPRVGELVMYDRLRYRVDDVFHGNTPRLLISADGSSSSDREWAL